MDRKERLERIESINRHIEEFKEAIARGENVLENEGMILYAEYLRDVILEDYWR